MALSKFYLLIGFSVWSILIQSQSLSPCGNKKKIGEPKKYVNCYDKVGYDEEQNIYVLAKDRVTPFDGTCQSCYRNGLVMEQITARQGKRDGTDTSYYSSGCIQSIQTFVVGIQHDKVSIYFDSTGKIMKEVGFYMGKKNGTTIEYSRTGDTLVYINYLNENLNGEQREYDAEGNFYKSVFYVNGLLDGPHKTYDNQGKLEMFLNYKEGKKHGKWTYYHPNGKEAKIEYWDQGLKNGVFSMMDDKGTILFKGEFKKNIPVGEHIENNEKGKLIHQILFDKKGIKQYEMVVDEYGEKKILYDKSKENPAKTTSLGEEDDNPEDILQEKKKKGICKKHQKKKKEKKTK